MNKTAYKLCISAVFVLPALVLLSSAVYAETAEVLEGGDAADVTAPDTSVVSDVEDKVFVEETDPEFMGPLLPENVTPVLSFLDTPNAQVSNGLRATARYIDQFFANEKLAYESSGSSLRLLLDTVFAENGETGYDGKIRLRLRLPRTQNKLRLFFENEPEQLRDEAQPELEETPEDAANETEYFAGLQADLGSERKWRFKPSLGVKIRIPADIFARFRFYRTFNFAAWELYWDETFAWFDSSGWRFDSTLEWSYPLATQWLFRTTTFARWTDEAEYYTASQDFNVIHTLSSHRAISYQLGVYGIEEPSIHAEQYWFGVRYRQDVHRGFMFLELHPKVQFFKENDFSDEYSMLLRLEFFFQD